MAHGTPGEPRVLEPQQQSLLSGEGPFKLEVEYRLEGMCLGGDTYRQDADDIMRLYRGHVNGPELEAERDALRTANKELLEALKELADAVLHDWPHLPTNTHLQKARNLIAKHGRDHD